MAEAKGRRTAASDFVSKIVKDPKQPPNTLLLKGYLGDSSEEGYTRLYLDPQLSDYVEIPADAILHTQDVADDALGGSHVWIQRDAEILHGKVGSDRLKAKFLEGRIYQQYMRGAQFGGGGGVQGFTLSGPQCQLAPPTPGLPQCNLPALTPGPPFCPPPTIGSPQCPPQSSPIAVCPTQVCGGNVSASPQQCSALFPPCPPESRWWGCPPSVFSPPCELLTASPVKCQTWSPQLCPPPPTQPTQCPVISACGPCPTPGSPLCPVSNPIAVCPTQVCEVVTAFSQQCLPQTLRGCPSAVDACPSLWGCGTPGGFGGGWGR